MADGILHTLDSFHKAASQNGLQFMVIGGFAASYWGIARFTADIDFVIEETSFEAVEELLAELDLTEKRI